MSHDIHRPIGWAYPKGLYFDPRKVLTLGYFLIAENDGDMANISEARKAFFSNMHYKSIEPHGQKFIQVLGELYWNSVSFLRRILNGI